MTINSIERTSMHVLVCRDTDGITKRITVMVEIDIDMLVAYMTRRALLTKTGTSAWQGDLIAARIVHRENLPCTTV